MRRRLTEAEGRHAEASDRAMADAPEAAMRRRDFLSRTALAAGLAGAAASLPVDLLLGEAAKREALAAGAAHPAEHADRPLRRPDDGEPVVRPLLRLAAGRRRGAGPHLSRPRQRQRAGAAPATPRRSAQAQWQGCGHPDPDHSWDGGRAQLGSSRTEPARGAGRLPRGRQRRVRALLLRRGRPRLHPPGGQGVHGLRPLPLLADGLDLAQPLLHVVGAVRRAGSDNNPPADTARQPVGDALRPRAREQPGQPPGPGR